MKLFCECNNEPFNQEEWEQLLIIKIGNEKFYKHIFAKSKKKIFSFLLYTVNAHLLSTYTSWPWILYTMVYLIQKIIQ